MASSPSTVHFLVLPDAQADSVSLKDVRVDGCRKTQQRVGEDVVGGGVARLLVYCIDVRCKRELDLPTIHPRWLVSKEFTFAFVQHDRHPER